MPAKASELHELGDRHQAGQRAEDALRAYQAAVALDPANAPLHYNVGNTLRLMRRWPEAIESYDRAIALRLDFAIAHHNRALCFLQLGDLVTGFRAYEWRKACPTFHDPRYAAPNQWAGEDIGGRTLFIYPELFFGDLIQFGRYALAARQRGARILLGAPAAMHRLLRGLGPEITLLPEDADPQEVDYRCALMSLPAAFGTSLRDVPWAPAYLRAEPDRVAHWGRRIGGEGFKVGVAWQGSPGAAQRSFPLAAMARFATLPGVRLISLQKINGLEQLASLPAGMAVEDLGPDFDPGPDLYLDTAAAMQACDLVISPDTSVVHLAGALGVPTWLALPYVEDWRWLAGRSRTPWYPSVRLFRQPAVGDWPGLFDQMRAALAEQLLGADP